LVDPAEALAVNVVDEDDSRDLAALGVEASGAA
jgi:hypothetical protein